MSVEKEIRLNDGNTIPVIGLGTFHGNYGCSSVPDIVLSAVKSAIDLGYRFFDTACLYDTEQLIGEAVREKIQEGVVKREDIFIMTKLWCNSHRKDDVVPALRQSLQKLGLEYVDMFLIHWPVGTKPGDNILQKNEKGDQMILDEESDFTETWKGMVECKRLGLTRSIGISNFNRSQIKRLINSTTEVPASIQVEVNPFFPNTKLIDLCKEHNIVVSCYSPLGKPGRPWKKDDDPFVRTDVTLNAIGRTHNKTPMQVALRFLLQRGLVVVPKSLTYEHIKENIEVFDFQLSEEEVNSILANCGSRNFRVLYLRELLGHSKEYPFNED